MPEPTINATKRPISPGMEEHLDVFHTVLDKGFIRPVDYLGNDAAVVQMARTSYGAGTKSVSDDRNLLRYLMRHLHTSPLEGCVLKIHVKLPVLTMRQWIRHRTASACELSGRYSIMPDEFYVPELSRLATQSKDNKQGSGEPLQVDHAALVRAILQDEADRAFDTYNVLLGELDDAPTAVSGDEDRDMLQALSRSGQYPGLARELARQNLPLSTYTEMYWQINLHNLLHFLKLRLAPDAQYEIRAYAEVLWRILCDWVPMTAEAFRDYTLEAAHFSRMEMTAIRSMIANSIRALNENGIVQNDTCKPDVNELTKYGMSKREAGEFLEKLGLWSSDEPGILTLQGLKYPHLQVPTTPILE